MRSPAPPWEYATVVLLMAFLLALALAKLKDGTGTAGHTGNGMIPALSAHCSGEAPNVWQLGLRYLQLLLSAIAMAVFVSCGGGGGGGGGTPPNPGTPAGSYTLTVTGTVGSGASALSHSMTLILNVN